MINLEEIEKWTKSFLESNLDHARWQYHNFKHTHAVVTAVDILGDKANLTVEEKTLLHIAALFHDLGFVVTPGDHETQSVDIAKKYLPSFGVKEGDIAQICTLIMATKMPTHPTGKLQEILCDADLSQLASAEFPETSSSLRKELETQGKVFSDKDWWKFESDFVKKVRYYSNEAREVFSQGLEQNIQYIDTKLVTYRSC